MKRRNKTKKRFNMRIRLLYSSLTFIALLIGLYCVSLSYSQNRSSDSDSSNLDKPCSNAKFKVISCHDGDTCKVEVLGVSLNVRLADIDAPELSRKKSIPSQPFSESSTKKINELVQGKKVSLKQITTDMYNRPIVEMIDETGRNINITMLELGLAEIYQGSRKAQPRSLEYVKAQALAKKEKRGIWSLPVSSYQSPYEYRKANSKK